MDTLNDAIGLKDEKVAAGRCCYQCAIIAGAESDRFPERKATQKLIEQPVFAVLAQFHCGKSSGNASTVSEMELKSECIVIAPRIDLLNSKAMMKLHHIMN